MRPEEIEHCEPSRDMLNKLFNGDVKLPEQENELVQAFTHIEMCYHGYRQMNLCHQLWHKVQGLVNPSNANYHRIAAMYYAEAKRRLRAAMNPQQEPGIDY